MNSHAPHRSTNRSFKRRSKKDNVLLRQQEAASALHLQEPLHSENKDKMHAVYASAVAQREADKENAFWRDFYIALVHANYHADRQDRNRDVA